MNTIVTIRTKEIVHPRFGGVGFNVFHHWWNDEKTPILDDLINKRWHEMNPSFARIPDRLFCWDRSTLDSVAKTLAELKQTGTEIYMTSWYPQDVAPGPERADYAGRIADAMKYLVQVLGLTNISYYCMTNELEMNGQSNNLAHDLPKFKDYHAEILKAFKLRNLTVKLLATDAAGLGNCRQTIPWAIENMNDITGIYGGHHYVGYVWNGRIYENYPPDDPSFYPWWVKEMQWLSRTAQKAGKDFVLGEFGINANFGTKEKPDFRPCSDTPLESMSALQTAEAVVGAINAGIYATCYWTFMDFPDGALGPGPKTQIYGTFRCSGEDHSTRANYYAQGLLAKFFRGPATVFRVACDDSMLRVAALQHNGAETYSIAIISRLQGKRKVTINLENMETDQLFRKYVYDPANVPQNAFGDLQDAVSVVKMERGQMSDDIAGNVLTVYTTAYDDRSPAEVDGVRVIERLDDKPVVVWNHNRAHDLCYYRVYRSEKADFAPNPKVQIGSTRRTNWVDNGGNFKAKHHYKVVAVDQSGNVSPCTSSYQYKSIVEGPGKK